MTPSKKTELTGLTRRDVLKLSGLALGGLAFGGATSSLGAGTVHADHTCTDDSYTCPAGPTCNWENYAKSQRYTYFEELDPFYPFSDTDPFSEATTTTLPQLGENEMRITFMGSCIPPARRAQQSMSVFVEVGWDKEAV